jgi:hypothetical protein
LVFCCSAAADFPTNPSVSVTVLLPPSFKFYPSRAPPNLKNAPLELQFGQFCEKHIQDAVSILSPGPTADESDLPNIALLVLPFHPAQELVNLIKKELKPFRPRAKRNKDQPRGKSA